jgi:hypothetical protein
MKRAVIFASLLFAWVMGALTPWSPPSASATVLPAWDLEALIAHSQWAVIARVTRQGTQLDASDGTLYTITELALERAIYGDPLPQKLLLRQRGGHIPEHTQLVLGNPSLAPGQRWALFLNPGEGPFLVISGMSLGAYLIEDVSPPPATSTTAPASAPTLRPSAGAHTVAPAGEPPTPLRTPLSLCDGMPVDAFILKVQALRALQAAGAPAVTEGAAP